MWSTTLQSVLTNGDVGDKGSNCEKAGVGRQLCVTHVHSDDNCPSTIIVSCYHLQHTQSQWSAIGQIKGYTCESLCIKYIIQFIQLRLKSYMFFSKCCSFVATDNTDTNQKQYLKFEFVKWKCGASWSCGSGFLSPRRSHTWFHAMSFFQWPFKWTIRTGN